jgi:hypothetical protein
VSNIDLWRSSRFLSILILIPLALLACGNQPGVVEGTVIQADGGEPPAQAEVVVYELQKAQGDSQLDVFQKGAALQREPIAEDGSYRLSLDPGSYIVQVWAGNIPLGDRLVEIRAGRKVRVDFQVASPAP